MVVYGWVLVPSHCHLLVGESGDFSLSEIFRDFKKYTSKQFIASIKAVGESRREWLLKAFFEEGQRLKRITHYKVWKDGNHPKRIDNDVQLRRALQYIHKNPVEAGYVNEDIHWRWSSAIDYNGEKGEIPIVFVA